MTHRPTLRSRSARILLVSAMSAAALIAPTAPAAAAAPQTTITSGPSGLIASRSATFRFKSSLKGSTFQCKLDAGRWAKCTSPKRYSRLSQGGHTFRVRARRNGAVDRTPASRSFTVDTLAPNTTASIWPWPRVADHIPHIDFASNDATATFQCRLDGAAFAPCVSGVALENLLPDRNYVFHVRARDAAGNLDPTPAAVPFSKVSQLSFNQETGDNLAEYFFPDQLTMDVPASCSGTQVDCADGIPTPPADQLSMSSIRSVVPINGANRYDVSVAMAVATLQPITLTLSGTDCNLTLNSAAGSSPTMSVTVQEAVLSHATSGERFFSSSNVNVVMEDSDYQIAPRTGSDFLCFGAFFIPRSVVEGSLESMLSDRMLSTCMAPGPPLFETCPWVFE